MWVGVISADAPGIESGRRCVSGADGVGDEPRTAAGETGGTRRRLEGYVRDLDVFPTGSRKSSNSFK